MFNLIYREFRDEKSQLTGVMVDLFRIKPGKHNFTRTLEFSTKENIITLDNVAYVRVDGVEYFNTDNT